MVHATASDRAVRSQSNEQQQATTQRIDQVNVAGRGLFWLGRHIPTLMVVVLIAGVGAYGHYSGWKLPKFSALSGAAPGEAEDWCEEHGVPESQCVECHSDLLPKGEDYGWCKEHGVHDCPLCHPDVAQLKEPPVVADADRQRAARALAVVPRHENNPICKNHLRRIQFASLEAMNKAGVDVALVDRRPLVEAIAANGQITYDQTRFVTLSSRLPGTVWRVEKNVGDGVRAGEVLALIDAAEVGRAKSELIQALTHEQLKRNLLEQMQSAADVMPQIQLQKAQADAIQAGTRVLAAQQALENLGLAVNVDGLRGMPEEKRTDRLRLLGLPESIATRLSPAETTANLLPIKAPQDGIVVARRAVEGEVVDASRVLFQVADTRRMWLTLNVSAEDARELAIGQPVAFRPDGSRADVIGKVVWISTTADQQTRTVAVRAELPNPHAQLRNETFGSGRIVLRDEPEAVVVPAEAVHWEGCCHVVFVRDKGFFNSDSPKVFHVRTVRLGAKSDGAAEIIAGVLPGEVVAARGSDVLRAELLKNNLGEGCSCGK